jgi:Restriction endonuclease S subunits
MVKYLRAANVKDGELDLTDVMSMNFTPGERKIFALQPGDVLVTEGSGSLASVGASAMWQGEFDGPVCFQNTLLRLRPRIDITDGRFLGWWARSAFYSGMFASLAGGANIYHLSAERVRAMRIDLPPLEEQRRIADFLDAEMGRIDRLGFLQRAALRLLNERSTVLLDLKLEQHTVRFGVVPLRRFIVAMGQGTSPQCDAVPAGDDEWGVLKVSCLRFGEFFPSENKRLPNGVIPETAHEVREGDLLITRANTPALVGATAVVPEVRRKLLLSDKIFRVCLASGIDPHYVAAVARGSRVRSMCSAVSNGASQSMVNIRFEEVKEWPIPKASLGEQRRLVSDVTESQDKTGRLRTAIERQLELLAERRQALITAAVTGQIDITTARGVDMS